MAQAHAEHLHFRCVFDLSGVNGQPADWHHIVKRAHAWVTRRVPKPYEITEASFLKGTEFAVPGRTEVRIASASEIGTGSAKRPQFWAFEVEHPCADVMPRRWRMQMGLTCMEGGPIRLSVAVSHWIRPGWVGQEPDSPVPSAPRIVLDLINDRAFTPTVGSERLTTTPQSLPEGQGVAWQQRLEDQARGCPVVFVSRVERTGQVLLDPSSLARLLAGAATVVEAATSGVDEELRYIIPGRVRCWDGAVRIYLPGVVCDSDEDSRRHRYFDRRDIEEQGPKAIEDYITRALARRSPTIDPEAVTSVRDVTRARREARLLELGAEKKGLEEFDRLLMEENRQLKEDRDASTKARAVLQDDLEMAQMEIQEEREKTREAQDAEKRERQARIDAESKARELARARDAMRGMDTLPASLSEVVDVIARLFPDRIVFTDRARKSAETASINNAAGEIPEAWRCLHHMATTLWDLYFEDGADTGAVLTRFQNATGLDLALTESKETKKDNKLMALRIEPYKGDDLAIQAHVGFGNRPPKILRVHYAAYQKDRVIVVGHCGDHLRTAGTKRRGER